MQIYVGRNRIRVAKTFFVGLIAFFVIVSTSSVLSYHSENSTEILKIKIEDAQQLDALKARGVEIIADYNNGYVLAKVKEGEISYFGRFFNVQNSNEWNKIYLTPSGITIDTKGDLPSIPENLMSKQTTDEYIIQFTGPIKKDWIIEIGNMGGDFYSYFKYYSFLVKINPSYISAVRNLPYVNWVGTYQPAYKIANGLMDGSGAQFIAVYGYNQFDSYEMAKKLGNLGATVYIAHQTGLVFANTEISIIQNIAALPDVRVIYPEEPIKERMDSVANKIHKYSHAWYKEWSGLPSTLTGTDEIAGILDTGFDTGDSNDGHIDFFDSPNGDRIVNYLGASPWSAANPDGWGYMCDPHGTAIAGIIASDGYAWETAYGLDTTDKEWHESEAGVAPESKLTIVGAAGNFGAGIWGGVGYTGTSCNGKPCWDAMYLDDGAKTITNSWGGTSPYNPAIDQRIDKWNDLMILFAAGDYGPSSDSINEGLALNKNGLTVGASQNYRLEWTEALDPNVIADFSSRGGMLTSGGRIKPDIMAVGTGVITTMGPYGYICNSDFPMFKQGVPRPEYIMEVDEYNFAIKGCGQDGINDYRYFDGTSASSPMAAGGYMLIREYLREAKGIPNPTSDLAKAFLINGAVRMNQDLYDYPGWDQGWGRVNIQESLFPTPPRTNQFVKGQFNDTGTCDLASGTCTGVDNALTGSINTTVYSSDVPLKVTLAWIDYQGESLVRDLDLRIVSPSGVEYWGNFYGLNNASNKGWSIPNPGTDLPATYSDNPKLMMWDSDMLGWDDLNNIEQVEVKYPEPGTWTVEVIGSSIPIGSANFSVVFGADIGPQVSHKVDLRSEHPPILSVALGGTVSYPFTITNYGSSTDSIDLLAQSGLLGVEFKPTSPLSDLASRESRDSLAIIKAEDPALTPGVYPVVLRGISENDPAAIKAQDSIELTVEVLAPATPPLIQITTEATSDKDPSVLVLDDGTTKHIFIAYIKTIPTDPGVLPRLGGETVWLAYSTLDDEGNLAEPWNFTVITDLNEFPVDLRFNYFKPNTGGPYEGRIILTWTGYDPNWPSAKQQFDLGSWGRIAYSDPPYNTWNVVSIDENTGEEATNAKRTSFALIRETTQELIYVWEYFGSSSSEHPASIVQTWYRISTDGGATWGPPVKLFPTQPGDNMYYFFPTGCVDQNDVAWIFTQFRLPAGNDRDLALRIYDGSWSDGIMLWDTKTNLKYPTCMSTAEGTFGNRVYFSVANDLGGTDHTIWMSWTDGDYTSAIPPAEAPVDGSSSSFTGPYGPYTISLSDANSEKGPPLVMLNTTDPAGEKVWITYMEKSHIGIPPYPANPYGVPNIWTLHSADNFATFPGLIQVTADSTAKGHKMADALQIGGQGTIYEVFHANKGGLEAVNYDIYLSIYTQDWDTRPDIHGPITSHVNAIPNPFNIATENDFYLTANINDVVTGMSGIAEAQYAETSTAISNSNDVDWSFALPMSLSGSSPTEVASATLIPNGWHPGEVHRFWVRGKDIAGNWGDGAYIDIYVIGPPGIPPGPPTLISAVLTGANNEDVTLRWSLSPDDAAGENDVIRYEIYYSTIYAKNGVGYVLLDNVTAGTDIYVHYDAGDGDLNNYFYFVSAVDATGLSSWNGQAGKYVRALKEKLKELVSIPLVQQNTSILEVLKTIEGSYQIVHYYKSSDQSDHWKSFKPDKPWQHNDLLYIDHKIGFWIKMLSDDNLIVAGLVPESTTIVLERPWNLIGYPSFAPRTVADALSMIEYTKVEGWTDKPPQHLKIMHDDDIMSAGNGYWVRVHSTQTLIISN